MAANQRLRVRQSAGDRAVFQRRPGERKVRGLAPYCKKRSGGKSWMSRLCCFCRTSRRSTRTLCWRWMNASPPGGQADGQGRNSARRLTSPKNHSSPLNITRGISPKRRNPPCQIFSWQANAFVGGGLTPPPPGPLPPAAPRRPQSCRRAAPCSTPACGPPAPVRAPPPAFPKDPRTAGVPAPG